MNPNKDFRFEQDAEEAFKEGRYLDAIDLYEKASCVFDCNNEAMHDGICSFNIAKCHYLLGDKANAHDSFGTAAVIFESIGAKLQQATCYFYQGFIDYEEGKYGDSYEYIYRSSIMLKELKDNTAVAKTFLIIGNILLTRGIEDEALSYYEDAITQFGDDCLDSTNVMAAVCQCNTARCYVKEGKSAEALVVLTNARSIYIKLKDDVAQAKITHQLDVLEANNAASYDEVFGDDVDICEPTLDFAYHEKIEEEEEIAIADVDEVRPNKYKYDVDARAAAVVGPHLTGNSDEDFLTFSTDASKAKANGNIDNAITLYNRALNLVANNDKLYNIKANIHSGLAECYNEQGRYNEAIEEYQKALDEHKGASDNIAIAKCCDALAKVLIVSNQYDDALKIVKMGIDTLKLVDSPEIEIKAMLLRELGSISVYKGNADNGRKYYSDAMTYFEELGMLSEKSEVEKLYNNANLFDTKANAEEDTQHDVLLKYHQEAHANMESGNYRRAIEIYQEALNTLDRSASFANSVVIECNRELGVCYRKCENYDEAEKYLVESIRTCRKIGEKGTYLAELFMELSKNYAMQNNTSKLIKCYKQAFRIYASNYDDSEDFANCCYQLSSLIEDNPIERNDYVKLLQIARKIYCRVGGHAEDISDIDDKLA